MTEEQPILRVENVFKSLGGNQVLRGVSLTMLKGQIKVLVGPSGGGKSTLLQCISFLTPPDQGRIWLEDRAIHEAGKKEINAFRQQVGMIFQDFNLFDHLSAVDNVSIALRKVKKFSKAVALERAMRELERVGLAEKAGLYPAQLSGGQKQRVSVARALAMDPKVMLLDEPTSALDPELIGEVLSVIRNLADGGMTMIMATHQISFAAGLADEFMFMDQGQIVEQGPPSVLLAEGADSRTKSFCSKISELTGDGA
jgi:polar amino acid transport system ATP-binding protein